MHAVLSFSPGSVGGAGGCSSSWPESAAAPHWGCRPGQAARTLHWGPPPLCCQEPHADQPAERKRERESQRGNTPQATHNTQHTPRPGKRKKDKHLKTKDPLHHYKVHSELSSAGFFKFKCSLKMYTNILIPVFFHLELAACIPFYSEKKIHTNTKNNLWS